MPSITIKDIPENLYTLLKQQASSNRRSLNAQTLWILEKGVSGETRKKITIEAIRAARVTPDKLLDDERLEEIKSAGRK